MSLKNDVVLLEGEEKQFEIEGNAYTDSPNPVIRLIVSVFRIIGIILGYNMKSFIIITNRRVIKVDKEIILYFVPKNIIVTTLTKSSIREVGYAKTRRWLLFRSLYFNMETYTEKVKILYRGSLKELNNVVMEVVKVIS